MKLAICVLGYLLLPVLALPATIIVVRHGERIGGMSPDALLSPVGEDRARELAHVLKDTKLNRIYVTELQRTMQMAQPLATTQHLKFIVVPRKDVDDLVSQLKKLGDDETVLVIGHADTVPMIIERLGGSAAPMSEEEYDRLTIVETSSPGKPQVIMLRYGPAAK